jgi:hypothetical protein
MKCSECGHEMEYLETDGFYWCNYCSHDWGCILFLLALYVVLGIIFVALAG